MPSKGRPKVVVRLEPQLLADLQAAAAVQGVSMSAMIRQALGAWLPQAGSLRASTPKGAAPAKASPPKPPPQPVARVQLHLRVERYSKFVRGKKRAREEIEDQVLSDYDMEKVTKDGSDYRLWIPHDSDEDLDERIEEILTLAGQIADRRNCFIEAYVQSLDDPERMWD